MNKFVILSLAFASLAGVGILGTNIAIQVQDLTDFATLSEMPDSKCVCPNPDGSMLGSEFCEDFTGEIKDPNGVCKAIAPNADYGFPTLGVQGCGVGFWTNQNGDGILPSTVWPSGYVQDYYFNDMFHTTFELSTFGLNENKVVDDSEVILGTQDVEEVTEEVEVTAESQDVEEVTEEVEVTAESQDVEEVSEESELTDEQDVPRPQLIGSEVEIIINEDVGSEVTAESQDVEEEVTEEVEVTAESQDVEEVSEESELTDEQDVPRPQPVAREVEISTEDENDNGPTLLQALQLSGGNLNELMRESVAAMLNSAHDQVDYPFTVEEIMSMTQIAISNEDYSDTIKSLREANDKNNSPICRDFTVSPSP